ncbi:Putative transcriptional regulator, TetR family [Hoyosella subflava DQS3-9A1]|uniref:Putative transcriptional regulator, TetR family n=1 Tax=Hoyosella subflava (strain DSM 45089 / JCM 17490 / NBRC 109087 / DQS3-9A1) TaxID=443218 RepID=F6EP64_HOYSD|nr:Putative transcriptional regulator, TetR family [Hoyosella subflava DQS3-9A1]
MGRTSNDRSTPVPYAGLMTRSTVPPAPRRTQEQRSQEMRTRLQDATIDCLVEFGYAGATTPRIAERPA